jgi:hypothetical protein
LNKINWIVDLYLIDAPKFWQAFSHIDLRYLSQSKQGGASGKRCPRLVEWCRHL